MQTNADAHGAPVGPLANAIDRWIYVAMALVFLALILSGFIPESLQKIEAVRSGLRPPFPPVLHAHALVTGAWGLLLIVQTVLMATHNAALHRSLGRMAFLLAPTLVIVSVALVPALRHESAAAILHAPSEAVAGLKAAFAKSLDIMLIQTRSLTGFALMTAIGLWARTRNAGLHKRMMILSLVAILGAATNRIDWLPSTLPTSPFSIIAWPIVAVAPMFLWDLYRLKKIHAAYAIYIAFAVATAVPAMALWGTPVWRGTALALLGLPGLLD